MDKLRKAVSVILSIAMVFILTAVPSYAIVPFNVSVGNASGSAGGTASVDLSIAGNTDLSALTVYVYYKADVLTCTSVSTSKTANNSDTIWKIYGNNTENESQQSNTNDTMNISAGRKDAGWEMASFAYATSDAGGMTTPSGVMGSLTFTVASDTESCVTPIEVEVVKATNSSNADISAATTKGSITVTGVKPTLSGTVSLENSSGAALTDNTVTVDGTAAQTVRAAAASAKGTDLTDNTGLTWSVAGGSGVSIGAHTGIITVGAKAAAGSYTVTATPDGTNVLGSAASTTLTVARSSTLTLARVGLNKTSVAVAGGSAADQTAQATAYDQYDDPFSGAAWSISDGDTANVTINASTGAVTVKAAAKAVTYTVTAASGSGGSAVSKTAEFTVTRAASAPSNVTVSGGQGDILVPADGAGDSVSAAFSAAVTDQYGTAYSGTVTWSISPAMTGVSIDQAGKVTVASAAKAGIADTTGTAFTVTAKCGNAGGTAAITVKRAASAAAGVGIYKDPYSSTAAVITADTIVIPTTVTANTAVYAAKVFDQYGAVMSETPDISFATADSYVTYSGGTVSVKQGAVKDQTYTLTAASTSVPSKTASVVITVKDIDITWPTVTVNSSGLTYGNTWGQIISLSGGSANVNGTNVPGTFTVKNSTAIPNAGTQSYYISFKSADGAYDVDSAAATVAIAQKSVTVSGLTAGGRAYDGTRAVTLTGGQLVGVLAKDTGVVGAFPTGGTVTDANVGTGKAVTPDSGVSISGTNSGNYALTQPAVTVNITAAVMAITTPAPGMTLLANDMTHNASAAALKAYAALPSTVGISYSGKTGTVDIVWADAAQAWNVRGGAYTYVGTVSANPNFSNTPTLTAAVTVTPVKVTAITLTPTAVTKAMSEVDAAANYAALGLPAVAGATYDNNVAAPATPGITGWSMTLAQMQAINAANGDVTSALTPTINWPAWATVSAAVPTVAYTITSKYPVTVNVTAPAGITYGGTLGDPAASQTAIGNNGTDANAAFNYLYKGKTDAGKDYLSTEKPADAGTYTVTATLVSNTYSGKGTSAAFTIAKKGVTVSFTNPASLTYDNTAKAVAAEIIGKVGADDVSAAITYTRIAPTAGTASAAAPVSAGTYTVSASLVGAKASNYNLTGMNTETLIIAKADRGLTIGQTAKTLAGDTLSFTIKPSVGSNLDNSAAYLYLSDNTGTVTVGGSGVVNAIANGTAAITVTVPATANYNSAVAVCTVTAYTAAVTSASAASPDSGDKLTAAVSGTTIKVTGGVTVGAAITVTPVYADSVTGNATVIVTAADAAALAAGGTLTVSADGTAVSYKIDTSGVTIRPANVSLDEKHVTSDTSKISDTDDQAAVDTALNNAGTTSNGLGAAASAMLLADAVSKTGGTVTEVKAETNLKIEVTQYDSGANKSLSMKITPQVTYKDQTGTPIGETETIPNSAIKAPVRISVVLPAGFVSGESDKLVVRHVRESGDIEYIPVIVTSVKGSNPQQFVASWYQSDFSYVELMADARACTATYTFDDGTVKTVSYTAANLGQKLPADAKSGCTFNGWTDGTHTCTTVDQLLAVYSSGSASLTPEFTQDFSGGGGGGAAAVESCVITASVNDAACGTITPSGSVSVESGGSQTFAIAPRTGYVISDVLVDGKSIGAVKVYTFDSVAGNHAITVTFARAADVSDAFGDVDGSTWCHDAVQYVCDNGLMTGVSSNVFGVGDTLTRGMWVTMLYRMAGSPAVTGGENYSDVDSGTWCRDAIIWGSQSGIVRGFGDGTFGVNVPVTRQQLVAFLYRYVQYEKYDISGAASFAGYSDASRVWATAEMQWAIANGIMKGTSSTALSPNGNSTRGQAAAFLMRFGQKYNG